MLQSIYKAFRPGSIDQWNLTLEKSTLVVIPPASTTLKSVKPLLLSDLYIVF